MDLSLYNLYENFQISSQLDNDKRTNEDYKLLFDRNFIEPLFDVLFNELFQEKDVQGILKIRISKLLAEDTNKETQKKLILLGISLIHVFIYTNWWEVCIKDFGGTILNNNVIDQNIQAQITGGECIHSLMKNLICIIIPKLIFNEMEEYFTAYPGFYLWQLRFMIIYQMSLKVEHRQDVKPMFEKILTRYEADDTLEKFATRPPNDYLIFRATFLMEAQNMATLLGDLTLCNDVGEKFKTLIQPHFEAVLTGAMGKRTKFQATQVAQMVIKVKRPPGGGERIHSNSSLNGPENENLPQPTGMDHNLPKDVTLLDDTLLEAIQYGDGGGSNSPGPERGALLGEEGDPCLAELEKAYLLSVVHRLKMSHPNDPLLSEQIQPYLDAILKRPTTPLQSPPCWSLTYQTLYERSLLESEHKRKVERAALQMRELVDNARTPLVPAADPDDGQGSIPGWGKIFDLRAPWFFASGPPPPLWKIERTLAYTLLKLGNTNGALELFEKLDLWEDTVSCYISLGRRQKAEDVIRVRLEGGGNQKNAAELWCALGDVKSDPECYNKAYELSGQKSARAQRSLGYYHLKICKDIPTALAHFRRSLELVPAQPELLFTAGCLATAVADGRDLVTNGASLTANADHVTTLDYALAESCFRKSLIMEPDNFSAWNNLATLQLKTERLEQAYWTLKEALKYNYHGSWQIWENLVYVCASLRAIVDVIICLERLMDMLSPTVNATEASATSTTGGRLDTIPESSTRVAGPATAFRPIFERIFPDMLEAVVRSVTEDVNTFPNGAKASTLVPRIKQLFIDVTSKVCDNGKVWYLYGRFQLATADKSIPNHALPKLEIMGYFVKAYRYQVAAHKDWYNDEGQVAIVCRYLHTLSELCREVGSADFTAEERNQFGENLSSAKLLINNTIQRIKKSRSSNITESLDTTRDEGLPSLETDYTTVIKEIEKLQSP